MKVPMLPVEVTQPDLVGLLPRVLQDFVRLIGLEATMKIVKKYGGTRLYVPVVPRPDHPIALLIGLENLVELSRVYGLEDHFDIPKADKLMRHLRNQRIVDSYGPKSAAELAREHGLTERQIYEIVGKPLLPIEHQSLPLF